MSTSSLAEPRALTIGSVRRGLAAQVEAAAIDNPELDARLLVGSALGLDHAALTSSETRLISAADMQAIAAMAQRRLAREPVARIVGRKEFWSLDLRIDASTL